jgi:hypothetical protein
MEIGERVRFHFDSADWKWMEGSTLSSPSFGDRPNTSIVQALDNKLATVVSTPEAHEYAYPGVDFEAVVVEFDHWWGDTYWWSDEDNERTVCLVPVRALEVLAVNTPAESGPGPYELVKAIQGVASSRTALTAAEANLQRVYSELALVPL